MALSLERKFIIAALILLGAWASQATSRTLPKMSTANKHEQWMARYGRVYKDEAEREIRFKIFKDNVEFIESFNKDGKKAYKLGINEFADQTNEEFQASRNGYKLKSNQKSSQSMPFRYENVTAVPSSIDWRKKGAVTPIKDQGQCGSCWAFSSCHRRNHSTENWKTDLTLGARTGGLRQKGEDQGCEGGYMEDGFEFIVKNKGIALEASYPYTADDGTCNAKKEASHAAKISGYEKVPANSEAALLKAVANQPISVSIDASGSAFQFYSSGVFTGECGTDLDHGVTAVGYGTTSDGTKYWLVKNSWGTSWGDSGYIMMQRGITDKEGLCGIAMDASYPTA